ncbi:ATP-dependent nuclease [Porticoccus sp.]
MQTINKISCHGYRGFQTKQEIILAHPNGRFGSGLTILVGPNGGGKSTIIEAFRRLSSVSNVSFTEGKRNKHAGDRVFIEVEFDASSGTLKTVDKGGSETEWVSTDNTPPPKISFLPSRRVFDPYFQTGKWSRDIYYQSSSKFTNRAEPINSFSHRLFNALDNYEQFNTVFKKIYGKELNWTIDQNDNSQYYVKVEKPGNVFHNSDGMGEGLVSLLFLVDAIYESNENEILVIDEPELSLHPQLQRRLMLALGDLAKDRQVLFATHSPEMVSIDAILNGMEVTRVVDEENGSKAYRLDDECRNVFKLLEGDLFNPHAFAYESIACLFAEDNLVITEGQEDVVFFNKMITDLNLDFSIPFWGFGAGGASKIKLIAKILHSLGFKNISAVYDGDKPEDAEEFNEIFPEYRSFVIPAEDIRDKLDREGNIIKKGLYDSKKRLKTTYYDCCRNLLYDINKQVTS